VHTLRLLTWNVCRFEGNDGVVDPIRAADAIRHLEPDLVALQEVLHPGYVNGIATWPLREFGHELGMGLAFARNAYLQYGTQRGEFGNALLKRGPYDGAQNYLLPMTPAPPDGSTQRGLLSIRFDLKFRQFFVYTTHLDPRQSQPLQLAQLKEALAHIKLWNSPHVLMGDFNCPSPRDPDPESTERTQTIQSVLEAGYVDAGWFRGHKTFPAQNSRIDYIFVQAGVTISRCEVIDTPATRAASDHLPLYAELAL